ncbi:MAG: hypothetical protein JJE29_01180 [Peptostreptococcaceae bacterium]|nr:hypothetical protein [Peptostreptococcaceae bacterium]
MNRGRIVEEAIEKGFFTNKEIAGFYGREVGMDVVARDIEKIGGVVRIESHRGIILKRFAISLKPYESR